ncbi:hypothetical protein [Campylobacter concisus]|nr:hypothetical protein [Campylobacter concisus]MBS5810138.1 hypothetical protein [Campylobacter concisus]
MKFDNNNTANYTITSVNYVDKNAIKENFFKDNFDSDIEKAEKLLTFDWE